MTAVTIEEAQARLPELIEQLSAGEPIIILRGRQPVAELSRRPESAPLKKEGFGCCKGMVTYIADDFDAPLDDFRDYM